MAAARRRGDAHRRDVDAPRIDPPSIALAETALARRRYDEAHQRAAALGSLFPDDQAVERLRRSVRAHDAPEFRLDSQSRTEHGDAADRPGSGYDVRSALLAPPIADRWRLKAAYEFSQASPVEGVIRRTRYGAGVEAEWPDASLDATVWINRGNLDRMGVRLAGTWEIGDHLQFEGVGARYSVDTPLRATYYGISADGGGGRVSYAWDSATIASASLRRWWFTDGNDRLEASGFLAARVVERPDLTIELRPELWWGCEHAARCPVFQSPPEHVRRPDRGRAAPAVAVGTTEACATSCDSRRARSPRRTFPPAGPAWSRYEHILQLTTETALHYGAGYARRVYDGIPVEDLRLWINVGHRFP